jgi:glycosyltransferase involved in cell wall biosynthesis
MNNALDFAVDFTVAIPTYNGGHLLPELLNCLQKQVNTESFSWAIIVVDNNSNDNTAQVVKSYQENWPFPYPLLYFFEENQGLTPARRRAITEAKSELIGFLDDDNYPDINWVTAAYNFAQKYPQAGAYGSQVHANWEVEPSDNFKNRIAPFLAITERGNIPLLYQPHKKILPPGAGLVIRRQAYLQSVPMKPILRGRITGNMLTGEDIEMVSYIQKAGWEIWYNPAMELYHQIPQKRLTKEYLIPFFRGIGLSRYATRIVSIESKYQLFWLLAYVVNDLRKIFLHLCKYGINIKTDLVAACEMELLISSLISPFYLWKNGYFKS